MKTRIIDFWVLVMLALVGVNCQSAGTPGGLAVPSSFDSDSDGDGLSDDTEAMLLTDPHSSDTDGDGISDGDEYFVHFTNPAVADSDFDGLNDYDEIFVVGTNPNFDDSDFDGLSDGLEVNPTFGSDPLNADTDGDSILDGDEIALFLDLLIPNQIGTVSYVYCSDFIAVVVNGIEGVYERSGFQSGQFNSGFLVGDRVVLGQVLVPGNRTGAVKVNLRSRQTGIFLWDGDVSTGGGVITNAAPTTLSIRIYGVRGSVMK
jgi:hypothetical protein